jgi:hypothetical protein
MRSEVTPNLENERLRRENAAPRSALKATNRITAPYADDRPNGPPPRR